MLDSGHDGPLTALAFYQKDRASACLIIAQPQSGIRQLKLSVEPELRYALDCSCMRLDFANAVHKCATVRDKHLLKETFRAKLRPLASPHSLLSSGSL